jgi:hypothetical protein
MPGTNKDQLTEEEQQTIRRTINPLNPDFVAMAKLLGNGRCDRTRSLEVIGISVRAGRRQDFPGYM